MMMFILFVIKLKNSTEINFEKRKDMRISARNEAEKWGWPKATAQLQKYYKNIE